jgi:hypothetical protein
MRGEGSAPGGPCIDWEDKTGDLEHAHGHAAIHRTEKTKLGESSDDYDWYDTEFESRPDPPWFESLKQAILDLEAHQKRASGFQARSARKRERKEVLGWPPLIEGERLRLGNARSRYSVRVDAREQSPGRAIVAAKLGRGLHNIEVTEEDAELGVVRLQIPLSVVAPVEIGIAPVTPITLTNKENGGVVEVDLRNRSRSDHLVRLTVESTPAGWMGVPLGKPFAVIKAGKSRRVKVQVERMVPHEDADDLHPFTVRATLPGAGFDDITSTFYVAARDATR